MEKIILRPSSIQQYINCKAQWFNVHIMGMKTPPAAAANAGTSVHFGAEVGYREKIANGNLPPLSVVLDAAVETWQETVKQGELTYGEGETPEKCEHDIVRGMEDYYNDIMTTCDPIAVEKRYTYNLDHPMVESLSGTLDIVVERGVRDIKFTKKKSTASHYILQQSTYGLLRELNDEKVTHLGIHNVIRGKEAVEFAMPYKPEYAKFWINRILDDLEKFHQTGDESIFQGTSPTTYYLCSEKWCAFYDQCKFVEGLR